MSLHDEHIDVLGADLAAIITLSISVELLANGLRVTPGVIANAVGETLTDAVADYAAVGFIENATDECKIIAAAARYLTDAGAEVDA